VLEALAVGAPVIEAQAFADARGKFEIDQVFAGLFDFLFEILGLFENFDAGDVETARGDDRKRVRPR
jgi:hypothetical protein